MELIIIVRGRDAEASQYQEVVPVRMVLLAKHRVIKFQLQADINNKAFNINRF